MTDAVLNDVDVRENGTSQNHKNVTQMRIHATTLLRHVQAGMWRKTWLYSSYAKTKKY